MFWHNFKYFLKTLFRNKTLIFWTFAFPILLGTFFNMAFSDIEKKEQLDIIDIAIVDNTYFQTNTIYKTAFEELSNKKNKNRLFNTKYVKASSAKELLEDGKITGYLILTEEKPTVVVAKNGINETILKEVVEEINETTNIMTNIAREEIKKENFDSNERLQSFYANIYKQVLEKINSSQNTTNIKDISSANLSYTMIEFYTLIAMTCLYGGILGVYAINQTLANMSNKGKRIAVSPTSKIKLILSSVLASYIVQLIGLILLYLFTIFILKVDYGTNYPLVILLSLAGSLAGLSLGVFLASTLKTSENKKTGIVIAITMLCSFLSGMMGITMKYVIDKNIPIINKLNPANMITDGLYSLYYYTTNNRFYFNLISLLIFSIILIIISIFSLRRQKYDSI